MRWKTHPLLTAIALLVGVAACAPDSSPPGGVRPELAAVPERPALRYTDAEEQAVRRSLQDDRANAQYRGDLDRYVLARSEVEPTTPPALQLETPPAEASPVDGEPEAELTVTEEPSERPAEIELGSVDADDLGRLENLANTYGASRQRQSAAALAAAAEQEAQVELDRSSAGRVVHRVVFPPQGDTLSVAETTRLDLVIREFGRTVSWTVFAEAPDIILATARAGTIRDQLLAADIPPSIITIVPLSDRPVDLAELRIKR